MIYRVRRNIEGKIEKKVKEKKEVQKGRSNRGQEKRMWEERKQESQRYGPLVSLADTEKNHIGNESL